MSRAEINKSKLATKAGIIANLSQAYADLALDAHDCGYIAEFNAAYVAICLGNNIYTKITYDEFCAILDGIESYCDNRYRQGTKIWDTMFDQLSSSHYAMLDDYVIEIVNHCVDLELRHYDDVSRC